MSNNSFFSREIEMSVIGQFLNFSEQLENIDLVTEEDFFVAEHKILFRIVKDIFSKNLPMNLCLIFEEIRKKECLIRPSYITEISQISSVKEDLIFYLKILKEKSACRKLFQLFNNTIHNFSKSKIDSEKLFRKIQQDLEEINSYFYFKKDNLITISEIIGYPNLNEKSVFHRIEKSFKHRKLTNQDYNEFIHTGFSSIDERTSILEDGNFIIIAARPALGKTALSLNLSLNICNSNTPIGFFSLEMSKQQIGERLISLLSKKSCDDLKRGRLTENEFQNVQDISHSLSKMPLYIGGSDFSSFNILCTQARKWKRDYKIKVLFIDYLQLLVLDKTIENRQNEIAEISRGLKRLSQELNLPIICLSQLSRKVEDRNDKRPVLSDIRDSGQVEQDADIIILLNHKSYDEAQNEQIIELCIGKNRHGPIFSVFLTFDKCCGSFNELVSSW